jgi:hypothetical protein
MKGFLITPGNVPISLNDASRGMPTPALQALTPQKWYGALYYQAFKVKAGREKIYMLLGYKPKEGENNQKVIELLYYDKKLERWVFGKNAFAAPFDEERRHILEYSEEVTVSLKYHPNRRQMVFDHLVPMHPGMEGVYSFYVPDMSFDAFEWRKNKWHLIQNIDIRGRKSGPKFKNPTPQTPPKL